MWTTKTFLTKTKRGNILKIVREHYLRDDLLCGSAACNTCPHKDDEFVLDENPESICALFDYPHYLILDTNVVLHQIDVLEEDALTNVIILQTVLEEVKHQNTAIFQRLLEIIGNKKRKFYSFVNEHHKDTYIERNPGENQNDRNDRAIRRASAWYESHLSINSVVGQIPKIVLLTDDEKNRKLAQENGIVCCSVKDYIENVTGFVGLTDKLAKNVAPESCTRDALYPAHLTPAQVHDGIRNGKLHQGAFHASRDNFLEGTANVNGYEKPILLQGHIGINRAVDGDIVAIEIFPEEEWRKPSDIVLEDKADDPGDLLEEEGVLLNSAKPVNKADDEITPTGKVVGIIRRKWRQYCGILLPSKLPGATRHLFTPAEKCIPRVRIETRQSDLLASQRILVALDSWPRNSRYPLGHFVRALGPIGNKNAENEVILLEHDVPHARFSEAVLACLPPDDWTIPEEEIKKRVDLRSECICSVDPPGCTDIDDALHAKSIPGTTNNGLKKYEVGVHIADVTYFVRPNTALDKEAGNRSTTVYLVDRRIDMVPDLLSSNLCSLRGGEERLAFSCVWEIDENANVLSTKFHKSVIKSAAAMTYEEAQIAIDDKSRKDAIVSSLRILNALAKKLKKKRMDNGALLLASPEIRFQVDSETHDPVEVQSKKIMDTNSMVEEFMLLANTSVAEKLAAEFPQCALLRRHPAPPPAHFTAFLKAARQQVLVQCTTAREAPRALHRLPQGGATTGTSAVYYCSGGTPRTSPPSSRRRDNSVLLLGRHPAHFTAFLKAARQQVLVQCTTAREAPRALHRLPQGGATTGTSAVYYCSGGTPRTSPPSSRRRDNRYYCSVLLLGRHPAHFTAFLKAARQQVLVQCTTAREAPRALHRLPQGGATTGTSAVYYCSGGTPRTSPPSSRRRDNRYYCSVLLLGRHPAHFTAFLKAARQQVLVQCTTAREAPRALHRLPQGGATTGTSAVYYCSGGTPRTSPPSSRRRDNSVLLLGRHPAHFTAFLKAARQQVLVQCTTAREAPRALHRLPQGGATTGTSAVYYCSGGTPRTSPPSSRRRDNSVLLLGRHPAHFTAFLKAARQQVLVQCTTAREAPRALHRLPQGGATTGTSAVYYCSGGTPRTSPPSSRRRDNSVLLLGRHPAHFTAFLKAARQQVLVQCTTAREAPRALHRLPQGGATTGTSAVYYCSGGTPRTSPPSSRRRDNSVLLLGRHPAHFTAFLKAARQQVLVQCTTAREAPRALHRLPQGGATTGTSAVYYCSGGTPRTSPPSSRRRDNRYYCSVLLLGRHPAHFTAFLKAARQASWRSLH
ncbi:unnamed protein product [Arctia plantaginis]|uniref:Protein DIS3 homolog n=1 Tax=Arctia plantaginis TaxID=874455 RepID=A0A8S0ZXT0_ARCPL|nr:unnamed protein product [Arctia plantaginis]